MKNIVAVVALTALLTACDGGFTYSGTVVASTGNLPGSCRATLQHEGSVELWHDITFSPPKLEGLFMVAPSRGTYEMAVLCAGYKPFNRRIEYGAGVSAGSELDLGKIVLVPEHGT